MEAEKLKELFKKYHDGTCTEEEQALLENWYLRYNEDLDLDISPKKVKAIGQQIFRELPGNHTIFLRIGLRLIAAAVLLALIGTLSITFFSHPSSSKVAVVTNDIVPGGDKAVLTLSNGKKINLTDASKGKLASLGGMTINKSASGQISYQLSGDTIPTEFTSNNISTPNGGQWQVTLPDGTKVWLNSASSFTYPSSFSGAKERIVRLTGEAYFEVAKDKLHPFIVKSGSQEVKVLGTHFNIRNYPNEPKTETALVEGVVRVTDLLHGSIKTLIPGQKTILTAQNLTVAKADLEEIMAWKNGYFRFNDEQIGDIMRDLARWYDIDVVYKGVLSGDGLNGRVSRNKNISQVLSALEATNTVHFVVEGRRVTVMK